jgi:hypothetical protein
MQLRRDCLCPLEPEDSSGRKQPESGVTARSELRAPPLASYFCWLSTYLASGAREGTCVGR